jgi:hypothetical protein
MSWPKKFGDDGRRRGIDSLANHLCRASQVQLISTFHRRTALRHQAGVHRRCGRRRRRTDGSARWLSNPSVLSLRTRCHNGAWHERRLSRNPFHLRGSGPRGSALARSAPRPPCARSSPVRRPRRRTADRRTPPDARKRHGHRRMRRRRAVHRVTGRVATGHEAGLNLLPQWIRCAEHDSRHESHIGIFS